MATIAEFHRARDSWTTQHLQTSESDLRRVRAELQSGTVRGRENAYRLMSEAGRLSQRLRTFARQSARGVAPSGDRARHGAEWIVTRRQDGRRVYRVVSQQAVGTCAIDISEIGTWATEQVRAFVEQAGAVAEDAAVEAAFEVFDGWPVRSGFSKSMLRMQWTRLANGSVAIDLVSGANYTLIARATNAAMQQARRRWRELAVEVPRRLNRGRIDG